MKTPLEGAEEAMVTAQKGTSVIVKSATWIVVVLVYMTPSELESSEVVKSGQVMVEVADSGNGGRMKVHGAWQETC